MYDIKIGRLDSDPEAQGVIRPSDGSWQLVIDKNGYPHLYVRVNFEPDIAEGGATNGLLCVEDMMPKGVTIPDLMQGSFFGKPPPEEEEKAWAEMEERAKLGVPCPR